jgi:hypothetical protein
MKVSRRIFMRSGVLSAAACLAHPLQAIAAANRALPGDRNLPQRSGGSTPVSHGPLPHIESPEQKFAGLDHLSRDAFAEAVGSAFKVSTISGNGEVFWLTLLSVQDFELPAPLNSASMAVPPPAAISNAAQTSSFNLSFSGGPAQGVGQDTYFFEHPELGQFALLIVPAGPEQYVAVVNRLIVRQAIGV